MSTIYDDNSCISFELTDAECGNTHDIRPGGADGTAGTGDEIATVGVDDGGVYESPVSIGTVNYLRKLPCGPIDWKAIRTLFYKAFYLIDDLCSYAKINVLQKYSAGNIFDINESEHGFVVLPPGSSVSYSTSWGYTFLPAELRTLDNFATVNIRSYVGIDKCLFSDNVQLMEGFGLRLKINGVIVNFTRNDPRNQYDQQGTGESVNINNFYLEVPIVSSDINISDITYEFFTDPVGAGTVTCEKYNVRIEFDIVKTYRA